MKIDVFSKKMNELCPLELQEEWDNSGLQLNAQGTNGEINKVLVALEVSRDIIDEAKGCNADIIVTHHPLFFGAFKQIVPEMLPTEYAIELIKSGISVYSAHTNFDTMEGGNNDYFAELLGIKDVEIHGIIRSGSLIEKSSGEMPTVRDIAQSISEKLDIKPALIRLIGNPDAKISKVAWCTGAGSDYIMDAIDLGADLYITGDIKYHEATTIAEFGLNCLDIGHFDSEKIFTPNMAALMRRAFPDLEIIESGRDKNPFKTL